MFQFADGLVRRGHDATVVHQQFLDDRFTGVDDIWWHQFHPDTKHAYLDVSGSFDAVIGVDGRARPDLGRPFMWVQAWRVLPESVDHAIYTAACPKLCTSTWLMGAVAEHGTGPSHHVPYGLDHGRYRTTVPWEARARAIGALYHPHPLKGSGAAIEAMRLVRQHFSDVRFVMFGNVGTRPNLPDWIEYHHDPKQEVIVELYNEVSIWVQSSVIEGFGLTAIEAMACGATLVTTDCGGSRDYASSDTAVVTASPRPADIASALCSVLEYPEAAALLSYNGRLLARRFDWDRSAEILDGVLFS